VRQKFILSELKGHIFQQALQVTVVAMSFVGFDAVYFEWLLCA